MTLQELLHKIGFNEVSKSIIDIYYHDENDAQKTGIAAQYKKVWCDLLTRNISHDPDECVLHMKTFADGSGQKYVDVFRTIEGDPETYSVAGGDCGLLLAARLSNECIEHANEFCARLLYEMTFWGWDEAMIRRELET